MSTETTKLHHKITKLNKSLDELESQLEPLFLQPLAETLLGLDTIQQAKMQVVIPYVVYDLVFVYLKARGIDPMTHPVVKELDRVRQYFDKIKNAEESDQKRRLGIDKEAAGRFIKHAIAQAKNARLVDEDEEEEEDESTVGPSTSTERVPVKVTSKMLERAEYERNLREMGDEEEDDLEVFEEDEDVDEDYPMRAMEETPAEPTLDTHSVEKGKQKMVEGEGPQTDPVPGSRRKRPRIDPFAGYDESTPEPKGVREGSTSVAARTPGTPSSQSGCNTPASSAPDESRASKKKSRRKEKKQGP